MSETYKPSTPSVPVSKQVTEAHERALAGDRATALGAGLLETLERREDDGAKVAAPVVLKRFSVELRYGPQMMSASAEIAAPSIDTIMATIMEQGGLRLTTKLPTSSPSATSFQKGAFIFTQSIHSVVIIEELK